jgi:hypothetical protein
MVDSISVAVNHTSAINKILTMDYSTSTCPVNVYLASADKNDLVPKFEQMLMTPKLTDGFRDIIEIILKKYQKEMGGNHTLFLEYFIESVLEENEIEYFELAKRKTIAEQIEPLKLLTDIEIFSEEKDFINGIRFYVIVAQPEESEPVYFYHFYTPKKILKRKGLRAILGITGEYDRVDERYISFEESIDCISHNGFMFVINKNNFQAMFHFLEEVRATAQETLDAINFGLPIQNFDELVQAVNGNMTMLRKLKKIAAKPYIKDLKMSDIKKIIEINHLPVEVKEVEGQEKIIFNPNAKAREKYALLRIFNDDYLKSLMTGINYETTGKREV